MKKLLTMATVALFLFAPSALLPAEAKTYRTCGDLHRTYPTGVAKSAKFQNSGKGPIYKPRVSQNVYSANRRLDTDKDGILCEVIQKSETSKPVPSSPATNSETVTYSENCISMALSSESLRKLCTLKNQDIQKLRAQVISQRAKEIRPYNPTFTLALTPSVEVARETFEAQITAALKFFGTDFKSDNLHVSIFSRSEVNEAQRKFEEISPPNLKLAQWDMVRDSGNIGCGGQAAAKRDSRDSKVKYYFVLCVDLAVNPASYYGPLVSHEIYHLVQKSNYIDFYFDNPKTSLPHWLAEGSATLMGEVNRTSGSSSMYRGMWQNFPGYQDTMLSGDSKRVIEYYQSLEVENIGGPELSARSYGFGGLASEVLVAAFGYEKLRKFTNLFAADTDIRRNFREVYEFELDDFYGRMADYLKWWASTRQYLG